MKLTHLLISLTLCLTLVACAASPGGRNGGSADVPVVTALPESVATPTPAPTDTPPPTVTPTPIPLPTGIPLSLVGTPQIPNDQPIDATHALRLREVARWGQGAITGAVQSPDGSVIAVLRTQGVYWLSGAGYGVTSGVYTPFEVNFVAFSQDSELAAIAGRNGDIWLWDRMNATLLQSFFYPEHIDALALSPGGDLLAVGSYGWVYLQPTGGGQPVQLTRTEDWSSITSLAFSADASRLAAGMPSGAVEIWDVNSQSRLSAIGSDLMITRLEFSPDGTRLAGATSNNELVVWNLADASTWARLQADFSLLHGLQAEPVFADILPDWNKAALLTVQGGMRALRVHALPSGEALDQILLPEEGYFYPYFLAFTPDGSGLVTLAAEPDGLTTALSAWTLADATVAAQWALDPSVTSLSASPEGRSLAVGLSDGLVYLRDASSGLVTKSLERWHAQAVTGLQFIEDGTGLVSLSNGAHVLQTWHANPAKKTLNIVHEDPESANTRYYLSPDGTRYVQVPVSRCPLLMRDDCLLPAMNSAEDGTIVLPLELEKKMVILAAISYDSQSVVGYADGAYYLWSVANPTPQPIFTDEAVPDRMTFSPDGRWLAAVDRAGTIQVWDTQTWQLVAQMDHKRTEPVESFPSLPFNPPAEVSALLFSPDGTLLVSAGRDGQVRLWQIPGGRLLTALLPTDLRETVRFHEESHLYPPVTALAFAPGATRLYAGDIYGQVHVYAVE